MSRPRSFGQLLASLHTLVDELPGGSPAAAAPRGARPEPPASPGPKGKIPGDSYGIQARLDDQSKRLMAASTDGELKTAKGRRLFSTVENIQADYTADLEAGGGQLSTAQLQQLESQLNTSNAAIFLARQQAQVGKAKSQGKLTAAQVGALNKKMASVAKDVASGKDDRGTYLKQYQADLKAIAKARSRSHGTTAEPWSPGGGHLHAADTSNWESDAQFQASIQGSQWTAIKASQGTGYTDPTFQSRWNELGKKVASGQMALRMAYGFLDPGDGAAQAQHFLDVVGVHGPLPAGTRLCLDWEGAALNDPSALRDAANYIHKVTGTWPVIYVEGSMMDVAKRTVPQAPIWEAAYGSGINPNVPFFQYSDGPSYDHDVFNGSVAALRKFAGWS